MNPLILAPVLEIGKRLIDNLFPDPTQKAKAELDMMVLLQTQDLQKVLGQPVPVASGRAWAPADVPAAKPKPGGRRGPKPTQSPRPKNNNRRRPGRGKGAGQRSGKAA